MKKRPLLDPDWPAAKAIPLFLLFAAAMVGGNVIPQSRATRIYCTFTLIWCIIGLVFFWFAHGLVNRHVPTQEEINEERDQRESDRARAESEHTQRIEDHVLRLEAELREIKPKVEFAASRVSAIEKRQIGRQITDGQSLQIQSTLKNIKPFNFLVRFNQLGSDSRRLAQQLHRVLELSGWGKENKVADATASIQSNADFEFFLSPSDFPSPNSAPIQVAVLATLLNQHGIINSDTPISSNEKIPAGAMVIYVGGSP